MTTVNERQEKLAAEQAYKEHIHHTKINSAAVTDHILANIHTLHVKLHQYHWYVKGKNFYALHNVFENLYNENEMVLQIVEDFRSNREFTIRAIRLAQEEENDASEDSLISYKSYLDVNIWQLQAFINKDALEDDDYIDND